MRDNSILFIFLVLFVSPLSFAHSLDDAEAGIQEQEQYVQFVDRPAPPYSLADADGNVVSSEDLAEKIVVLNFIYTRCTEACPLHMNLIAQLQDRTNEAGLSDDVAFITIATDVEDIDGTRDNMRTYGRNFEFDPANWHFLYRSEDEPAETTLQIAEAYGLKFEEVDDGVQVHGVVTHVIDQAGEMRARFHGLKFDPDNLVAYLNMLVNGPEALDEGVWDRIVHYFEGMVG